ncbi:hypothetical protein PAXINDRAFT_14920 [Paxillus involutus ATCC 200175]|uniref:Uncharacterized protein n=1 Tax=Paxillus involutus ATCC 200175 TaxID=664439 RepID=A0A0C9T9K2_PAXIN|nr:hypothetical protein PAXINDRAFT_14920 [Paxillus involutus ATCC 200175]
MDPDQLGALPGTQSHQNIHLVILAADKEEGYSSMHIVSPSTIRMKMSSCISS